MNLSYDIIFILIMTLSSAYYEYRLYFENDLESVSLLTIMLLTLLGFSFYDPLFQVLFEIIYIITSTIFIKNRIQGGYEDVLINHIYLLTMINMISIFSLFISNNLSSNFKIYICVPILIYLIWIYLYTKDRKPISYLTKATRIMVLLHMIVYILYKSIYTHILEVESYDGYYMIILLGMSIILFLMHYVVNLISKENEEHLNEIVRYMNLDQTKFYMKATRSIHEENQYLRHILKDVSQLNKIQYQLPVHNNFIKTTNVTLDNIINTTILMNKDIDWQLRIESHYKTMPRTQLELLFVTLMELLTTSIEENTQCILTLKETKHIYLIKAQWESIQVLNANLLQSVVDGYKGTLLLDQKNEEKTLLIKLTKQEWGD